MVNQIDSAQPINVDVAIFGAGINGAGLFRDLCAQGIDCIIIDKGDYGSGTSAAPSRLIHGGLKYLETGEFGLVAQSTLERNLLLKNAPHYVTPLPTVIPIFSWTKGIGAALRTLFGSTSAPRSRGAILIKVGLAIYDYYGSRNRVMPRHSVVGRGRALKDMPALTKSIVAAGTYYDAKVSHPERLVLELVTDGLAANPASAAHNYTRLTDSQDGVLTLRNENNQEFSIRPKIVVNAAGPWIDHVNATLGAKSQMIGGTKGSHLLLKHDELVRMLDGRMVYFEADDGRICLVYDYHGLALVGSTDIPADNPDEVRCEPAEKDYMIGAVQALFPGLTISSEQIVYAYSGIRPLPASNAAIPGLISRDHSAPEIEADASRPFPIISLVGGKWTTFRGFAEEVADKLLGRLGRSRQASTRMMPIGGGREFPGDARARAEWLRNAAEASALGEQRLATLLDRYGTKALAIAQHRSPWNSEDHLPDSTDYSLAEIDYLLRAEQVHHLSDVVLRRTTLAISGSLTISDIHQIATMAGQAFNWSAERVSAEIENVLDALRHTNMMRL